MELDHPRARARPDEPHQRAVLERAAYGLNVVGGVVRDRIAAGGLVAGRLEGVEGEGITRRHGHLLLQQRPEDALLGRVEHGQTRRVTVHVLDLTTP